MSATFDGALLFESGRQGLSPLPTRQLLLTAGRVCGGSVMGSLWFAFVGEKTGGQHARTARLKLAARSIMPQPLAIG